MEQPYYNLKQLEAMYGIRVRTWREYVKRKDLRAFKIGRLYLVKKPDLLKFIEGEEKEAYHWRPKGVYPFSDE